MSFTPTFPRVDYTSAADPGSGVMTLAPDGSWKVAGTDGGMISEGTYQVRGSTLTWLTDSFCAEQGAGQGTYTWAWDGTQLTLTKVADECTDRVGVVAQAHVPLASVPSPATSG
jgi:hypothetical protein